MSFKELSGETANHSWRHSVHSKGFTDPLKTKLQHNRHTFDAHQLFRDI